MLKNIINFWQGREGSDCAVLGYASHSVDEVWIRSTLLACARSGIKVAFAWSNGEMSDEIVSLYTDAGIALYKNASQRFLQTCTAPLVLTASSGLEKDWFSKKHCLWRIHMPHSIASLHMIYPEDAFDGYNILFSVGPHHDREFEILSEQRQLTGRQSFPCGYGKLDVLKQMLLSQKIKPAHKPHILLAPSWGKHNILNVMGQDLMSALLEKGCAVTLRPHPLFFLENDPLLAEYEAIFSGHADYTLENSLSVGRALLSADILISDYSGTVQEFTALTGNPVVFVDVPTKMVNADWQKLEVQPIEMASRNNLGPLAASDVASVMAAIEDVRVRREYWLEQVKIFSAAYLHEGICADQATQYIEKLLTHSSDGKRPACH